MTITYGSKKLKDVFSSIRNGSLSVPSFQRGFDWSAKDIQRMYNSVVLKGEPFGSIVIWEDTDNSKAIPNEDKIFGQISREVSNTQKMYLIDGQQRVTSFVLSYLWHMNPSAKHLAKIVKVKFDISRKEFVIADENNNNGLIPSSLFHSRDFEEFRKGVATLFGANQKELSTEDTLVLQAAFIKFNDIDTGTITISSNDLNEVIDVFTLINTKGKRLSPFNIVHAYYIKGSKDFNLSGEYEKIISGHKEKWDLSMNTMLLLHYAILRDTISNKEIMDKAQDSIVQDIKFVKEQFKTIFVQSVSELESMGFVSQDFLPTDKFLYLMAKAIHLNGGKNLDATWTKIISRWFKLATINDRYASGADGAKVNGFKEDWILLKNALQNGELDEKAVKWIKNNVFIPGQIKELSYNSTSLDYKYVISKIIKYIPSITTGKPVVKVFNSPKNLNLHHIFPIGNSEFADFEDINSIVNLTPLEAEDNININNQSPVSYLSEKLKNQKSELFLLDIDINDFNKFISERSKKLTDKLNGEWE